MNKLIFGLIFTLVLIFFISSVSAEITQNIVSYYNLDETSGTTALDFFGTNDGLASNTAVFSTSIDGIINTGADFIGNSHYINLGSDTSLNLTGDMTISAWINITSGEGIFLSKDGGGGGQVHFELAMNSLGYIRSRIRSTAFEAQSSVDLRDGVFHHIVAVANGNILLLYVDGINVVNSTVGTDTIDIDTYIGARISNPSYFNGIVDEVGIWNRSLTQEEITGLYNSGVGISISNNLVQLISPIDNSLEFQNPIYFNTTLNSRTGWNITGASLFILDSDGNIITQASDVANSSTGFSPYVLSNSETIIWSNFTADNDFKISAIYKDPASLVTNYEIHDSLLPTSNIAQGTFVGAKGTNDNSTYTFTAGTEYALKWICSPACNQVYSDGLTLPVTDGVITYNERGTAGRYFNLDKIEYLIDGSTNDLTGTTNSTFWNKTMEVGEYTWNVLGSFTNGTDTEEVFALTNYSFTYGFGINSENFSLTATESESIYFDLNLTSDPSIVPSIINFWYNNTPYNVVFEGDSDSYFTSKTLIAPSVVGVTNMPFHWEVIFDSGFTINTTSRNQAVSPLTDIQISETCGGGFFPAITYTFGEEENLTTLISSTEFFFSFGFSGNPDASTVNGSFSNINDFSICIPDDVDGYIIGTNQIKYGIIPYVERTFYNFEEASLSNETTNTHVLYNLLASSSTSFLVTVQDLSLTALADKYVGMLRFYPQSNEYKIVEMGRTDENGRSVLKTVVEDVDYRFAVYEKNGTLLKLTDPLMMVCLVNPCELVIKIKEDVDFTSYLEVESSLTFDSDTNKFTFTWNDPNQLTTLMNLTVRRMTSTSENIVCSSSASGFTGVLTCDVTGETGVLKATVERSASPAVILRELIHDATASIIDVGGGSLGLFLSLILIIFVGLAGAINPIIAVMAGAIALIPALFFGSITIPILIGIVTMGWIVIHMMKKT